MKNKAAVICLCHNQEQYVEDAMSSVLQQTYPTELVVVDDASSDNSVKVIQQFIDSHPDENIKTLFFKENLGNCRAFNAALELTEADYIIDLASDDVLMPERVELGVEDLDSNCHSAINFTNANYINEEGHFLSTHYPVNEMGCSTIKVPTGLVFKNILERYYICSPTMMYRASFLRSIGGYDETLAYEDFDVMIRLSRKHPFSFTDKVLVKKRILPTSMSKKQYKKESKQLLSTLKICYKAYHMLQTKSDKKALIKRLIYEGKQAFLHKRFLLFFAFITLEFKTILRK